MKKVKDSLTLTQKSDMSRSIALKNAAEARRLGDRLKSYETHLHQQLVDLDAEIMDLRLSPLLRRKAQNPGIRPNRTLMQDTRPHSAVYPHTSHEKPPSIHEKPPSFHETLITDLNGRKVIPTITVIKDEPQSELKPGFLPKIRATSAAVVGNEQKHRYDEVEVRPHTSKTKKNTTLRSNSTENLSPSPPALDLPHEEFQRSRSFGEKDLVSRTRPRTPRRGKALEDLLRPQREAQTLPHTNTNPQQELDDRVKKFLNTPNPVTSGLLDVIPSQPDVHSLSSAETQVNLSANNELEITAPLQEEIIEVKTNSTAHENETETSLLANGHRLLETKNEKPADQEDSEHDKNEKQKGSTETQPEEQKTIQTQKDAETATYKERRTGIVEKPAVSPDREKTEEELEDIPSATGIPALDKLLLARAIEDIEGISGLSNQHDFDKILQLRLEALLKDPPSEEEMRKIRYLRLPDDKIPDILTSVFGNEDGSITSQSHGNLSLAGTKSTEEKDAVENSAAAEQN